MQDPVYNIVHATEQQTTHTANSNDEAPHYDFALAGLHGDGCAVFEADLTAEEVGQLLGGS